MWKAAYTPDCLVGPGRLTLPPAGEGGSDGTALFECYYARARPGLLLLHAWLPLLPLPANPWLCCVAACP